MASPMAYTGTSEFSELTRLKRSRGAHSSIVKRKHVEMQSLLDGHADVSLIQKKIEEYDVAFDKFKVVHEACNKMAAALQPSTPSHRNEHFQDMLISRDELYLRFEHYKRHHDQSNKDDVRPSDSVSNCSSSSTSSNSLAKASAKKAALKARAKYLDEQHNLEKEKLELQCKAEKLNLEADISAASAEEECLQRFVDSPELPCTNTLNPSASPFVPKVAKHATDRSGFNESNIDSESMQPISSQIFLKQMVDSICLPKSTVRKFDGEPTEYWLFINSFDSIVDKATVDDAIKLNRLFEYCEGKAAKVIKPCAFMSPTEGYTKARQLLKNRFGNNYVISDAWVRKVTEGGSIKANDAVGLLDLADDVHACVNTLTAMGNVGEIDNREKMIKIIDRLPHFIVSRWRKEAVSHLEKNGSYPNILKLSEFLYKVAKEMNDPVFGISHPNGQVSSISKGKVSSFSVQANDADTTKEIKCYLCEDNHRLVRCERFSCMKPTDKLEFVRNKRICFCCLGARSHIASQCRQLNGCDVCGKRHASCLHEAIMKDTSTPSDSQNGEHSNAASFVCSPNVPSNVTLPIVAVNVRGVGQTDYVKCLALLDPGSNKTFCSKEFMNKLGLEGDNSSLTIETLTDGVDLNVKEVSLEVTSVMGKQSNRKAIDLPKVYVLSRFPALNGCVARPDDVVKWEHLRDINVMQMRHMSQNKVDLLIGQDAPQALIPLEVREGKNGGPYAVRTALGWTLNGPMGDDLERVDGTCNFVHAAARIDTSLEKQVEHFWKLDTDHCATPIALSQDDKKVVELWTETTLLHDGHFEMHIPFKPNPVLPDNREIAEKRLKSLERRFLRKPELQEKYAAGISDMIDKGFAEVVPNESMDSTQEHTWYLPHHNVVNPNKPDKLRIVFDCAAEYKGTSLNRNVLQGPDLTNKLIGTLLRFRQDRVAVMGDIEAMFYQVKVAPECRDSLRFLWWKDGDLSQPVQVYRMTVHPFGGIWSPSCANFALHKTAELFAPEYDGDVVDIVKDNFYVDDCLASFPSDDKAIDSVHGVCDLLSKGGFRLTKWVSNSRNVVQSIPEEERSKAVKGLDLSRSTLPLERALGTLWCTETDTFRIQINTNERPLTRRGMLSVISSVYDPFGVVSPYVMKAKHMFQVECSSGRAWDDELSDVGKRRWLRWLEELPSLESLSVDRCFIPQEFGEVVQCELHHFCDASQDGYGAVSYIRMIDVAGNIHCAFVISKSRLAPMKYTSIPRLELCAAVVAVKLDELLHRELRLPLSTSTFWTDSNIVLQYIKNSSKRFHTFVANRVALIHEGTTPSQWKYVNTKVNPADDISRGLNAPELLENNRWKSGPGFLWCNESHWSESPEETSDLLLGDKEVKVQAAINAVEATECENLFQNLIDKYSDWFKLKKAVAWMLRFKAWLKDRKCKVGALCVEELHEAENCILRFAQRSHYVKEVSGVVTKQSHIHSLEPFLDKDGLLRVGGRLGNTVTIEDSQHQIIIPKESHVAKLVVRDAHENDTKHAGRETVLSALRCKFWIPQPRGLINQMLMSCVVCKRLRGKLQGQRMADLPCERITPGISAFEHVGIDCFGPFAVKRARSSVKRYGCIFTCLSMRAIHLEKLDDLSADSFINALIRFCARRGVPKTIRCDNGTNFVGAEREINKQFREQCATKKLDNYCLINGIEWIFNPPAASHMGGSWERQIRTVRKVLSVVLKDESLDDERLDTLFCLVESIVNSRPLTVSSDDIHDLEALTPNHLLLLRSNSVRLEDKFVPADVYTRRWRHVQLLADTFWRRWVREYIPTIQCRSRWFDAQENLKQGDVVLVSNEITARNDWPLGKVLEVFPGQDGLVRVAKVKTSSATLMRPVSKLCLLVSRDDNNEG